MKQLDYIVVGLGIAGVTFCEQLHKAGRSFVVIDRPDRNSSIVAGGVCHPLILKRFTLAWNAAQFLDYSRPFYDELTKRLEGDWVDDISVKRIFSSAEEQNDWMVATDKLTMAPLAVSDIEKNHNNGFNAPFGLGKVVVSFKVKTDELIQSYGDWLRSHDMLQDEIFDFEALEISENGVKYSEFSAKRIVFSEGSSAKNNPFFSKKALIGKRGEYLILKCPGLELFDILKGKYFIIPLGNDLYKVGATFSHDDDSYLISETNRETLIEFWQKVVNLPCTVENHIAGVRPTVKDRRPLLGNHPIYSPVAFFNGLGTRGIMMAPLLSEWLFKLLEEEIQLPKEVNISRYF